MKAMTPVELLARELCRWDWEDEEAEEWAWYFHRQRYRREARKLVKMVRGEK